MTQSLPLCRPLFELRKGFRYGFNQGITLDLTMCLILFAFQHHSEYPLIVTANRDEYYQRPSQPAHFWPQQPQIFAGRDLTAGGTWMGINRNNRFAAVTNFRGAHEAPSGALSRGSLCKNFLDSSIGAVQYLQTIHQHKNRYAGFNLLVGTIDELFYYSNQQGEIIPITAGIHGLSNGLLNEPWPKVARGKAELSQRLANSAEPTHLLSLLQDTNQANDEQLPDTGIGIEKERMLSSRFIQSADYGTRCSTVLTINRHHQAHWLEQHYDHKGPIRSPQLTTMKMQSENSLHYPASSTAGLIK